MLEFLKNHPFAVEAFFERSTVLTFAVPCAQLQPMIPECLTLDSYNDQFGFIAVAMVQTKALRPKGFPQWMGNDFFLVGYRIFVRYTNQKGKRLRGLYILQSQTNKKQMEWLGNLFTHYHYTTTDIQQEYNNDMVRISSRQSKFELSVALTGEALLPAGSPFKDWKEARRFAGPLPFTFSYTPDTKEVLIVEGVREDWIPKPVNVLHHQFHYLQSLPLKQVTLANAFVIEHVPYHWKKGIIEQWKQ